nr:NAD(P)H-binding protein [Pseudonocardia acidicola]
MVIGATGSIGARLVPRLLADGYAVRCLIRDTAKLTRLDWATRVEALPGDATDPRTTRQACRDVDVVFSLVHSMTGPDFAARDRIAAAVLGGAARAAGADPPRGTGAGRRAAATCGDEAARTACPELRAELLDATRSRYVQRVTFRPDGLAGRLCWYAQLPAHDFLFAVMARTVAGVASGRARAIRAG